MTAPLNAAYAHTCIVALDWRRLAQFYEDVFGCRRLVPERDNSGEWVDRLTGLRNVRAQGVHLRLPPIGSGDSGGSGPTLEIFQYASPAERVVPAVHRPGLSHLAFRVDDVDEARRRVLDSGGADVGEVVTADIPGAGTATLAYMADPEGNIVELQHWT